LNDLTLFLYSTDYYICATLRNRERQKPNIQQRHKWTTGETAAATNCRIRQRPNKRLESEPIDFLHFTVLSTSLNFYFRYFACDNFLVENGDSVIDSLCSKKQRGSSKF
jgi:hypothetical protein